MFELIGGMVSLGVYKVYTSTSAYVFFGVPNFIPLNFFLSYFLPDFFDFVFAGELT
jgi:hypothetical protein